MLNVEFRVPKELLSSDDARAGGVILQQYWSFVTRLNVIADTLVSAGTAGPAG